MSENEIYKSKYGKGNVKTGNIPILYKATLHIPILYKDYLKQFFFNIRAKSMISYYNLLCLVP